MMRVLVSGATGFVGRFVVEHLLAHGHEVVAGIRHASPPVTFSRPVETVSLSLDPDRDATEAFRDIDGFVHAAFRHVPGRYRGGEGSDPAGFRRDNRNGSIHLFETARRTGVRRAVFLSSRAVYGRQPAGMRLIEDTEPQPESLYGVVKREVEQVLATMNGEGFATVSLRATGVYGALTPDEPQKWDGLCADYLAGRTVADRIGTEVHGTDLAEAVRLMLLADAGAIGGETFNVSDILTGYRDILSILQQETGCGHPLPEAMDSTGFNVMDTTKLQALGWTPGGQSHLQDSVRQIAKRLSATLSPC